MGARRTATRRCIFYAFNGCKEDGDAALYILQFSMGAGRTATRCENCALLMGARRTATRRTATRRCIFCTFNGCKEDGDAALYILQFQWVQEDGDAALYILQFSMGAGRTATRCENCALLMGARRTATRRCIFCSL
ncbi:hypothetical protein EVAR_35342_1 [Eumeta japonica]|uniref:Uncharacterized protein n=1 Tax=Eumeta variegata TaxID=151549 RepID=A0A4C1XKC7_EUMVA|nr:hypothetical protein EVAR_35342_1 [Eumeta japonica]